MNIVRQQYKKYLSELQVTGKLRQLPESKSGDFLDFSSNDYLCLSKSSTLLDGAVHVGQVCGVGSTGSRLLSGNVPIFTELENKIARDKNTEAALIFSSGFQANLSGLSCLLDKKVLGERPIVFFDRLNHSSLYQGVFLSGAELLRYKHNDMQSLSALLDEYLNVQRPKFIVSETLFGMDGDCAPGEQLASIAKAHRACLYLDEAHATGMLGARGYGMSTQLPEFNGVVMGTLSKALGCSGGYIACSKLLRDYMINKASGFIYSTAPSPMLMGAASAAWDMVKEFDEQRVRLFQLSAKLRGRLVGLGFNIGSSSTHIVPIILGSEEAATRTREKLYAAGIIVSCIRPPTVPAGTSRIRVALNVEHTQQDIDRLVGSL